MGDILGGNVMSDQQEDYRFRANFLPTNDSSGDAFLEIPETIMKVLNLEIGDAVEVDVDQGRILIKKSVE